MLRRMDPDRDRQRPVSRSAGNSRAGPRSTPGCETPFANWSTHPAAHRESNLVAFEIAIARSHPERSWGITTRSTTTTRSLGLCAPTRRAPRHLRQRFHQVAGRGPDQVLLLDPRSLCGMLAQKPPSWRDTRKQSGPPRAGVGSIILWTACRRAPRIAQSLC
jgi:hypothetical protein